MWHCTKKHLHVQIIYLYAHCKTEEANRFSLKNPYFRESPYFVHWYNFTSYLRVWIWRKFLTCYRSGLLERMPLMERARNGNGEAITNGDTGMDGEDDLVDTEEMDRPKHIKKAEVAICLCPINVSNVFKVCLHQSNICILLNYFV